jgi:formylglycine-generating enzyme required for sulfatase activity
VGSHPEGASPSGALDMSGNVEEWTTTVIPGAFPAPIYETRGGNYELDPVDDADWTDRRADLPGSSNPTSPKPTLGFRCAMDAVE